MVIPNDKMKGVHIMTREEELRLHRCCFTGHRPEKLSGSEQYIKKELEAAIRQAIRDGFVTFISGMARGVDIWAAEIVLRLKKEGYPIHLICAVPFRGFEDNWEHEWKVRYRDIMANTDLIRCISPSYHRRCFQDRNEWMCNRASRLIAVYNGASGGTRNTINYALSIRIEVVKIQS